MVLGVDGDLHIVADGGGAFAAGRHRTGVGIGQRDLLVGCVLNPPLHHLQGLHLPAQAGNFSFSRLDLSRATSLSSRSVRSSAGTREEFEPTAKRDELSAHRPVTAPLSLRKSAIVLKSGASRPVSQTQGGKVQFVDEDLDHPNRVFLVDVILQAVR
jgi:hypothetical protein